MPPVGQSPGAVWPLLRRRIWLILLAVLVGTGAAAAVSSRRTPVYAATSDVVLDHGVSDGLFDNGLTQPKTVDTEARFATSPAISGAVRQRLGNVAVPVSSPIPGTNVFEIKAKAASGKEAAAIANAYADAYTSLRRTQAIDDLTRAEAKLQQKMSDIQGEIDGISARIAAAAGDNRIVLENNLGGRRNALIGEQAVFKQQLDELDVAAELRTGGVSILRRAIPPPSPTSPATLRNVIAGALSAMVIAVALVLIVPTTGAGKLER